jgi:multiple sugar transport system permease protein
MTVASQVSLRRTRRRTHALTYTALAVLSIVVLSPYFWLLETSFKTRVDAFAIPPKIFFHPTLSNYTVAFINKGFLHNLYNSVIIAAGATAVALAVGVPSAYAFSRFRLRGSRLLLLWLLASRMLPAIALVLPMFIVFAGLGLVDTYPGVIIAHVTFDMPFVVWMMKGFFDAIPSELSDAALMDGCSHFAAFRRVALPLTAGGLAATSIFCLINSWNDFLYALVLTGRNTATLPVGVAGLLTPWGTYWGQIAAVGTVTTLPVLIFAFAVQKYLVRGLTGGAISGG